ncbi:hypothetical protein BVI1335_2580009 [Burkholderia vietnamiensis]|nr:hypothetical protein BVI1335_2580009 [Burkholderia vietnamiensis]
MQVMLRVACSCDRKKLLWPPEFNSGPDRVARSSLSGQFPAVKLAITGRDATFARSVDHTFGRRTRSQYR